MKSGKPARILLASVLALVMVSSAVAQQETSAKKERVSVADKPIVVIETSMGNIRLELDAKKAPVTVENFPSYVREGFYDGLIFHRVIENFMIQGGGFEPDMTQRKPKAPIENEAANGLKNDLGTIAMARTGVVNSATSQFFINVKDNGFLNHKDKTARGFGYCVFGKVIEGMDVVDKIKRVRTATKMGQADVPVKPVVIKSSHVAGEARRKKDDDAQMIKGKKPSSTDKKAEKLDPGELAKPER